MRSLRFGYIGLLALGLAIAAGTAQGQTLAKQLEQFKKTANEPGEARSKIAEFKDGKLALTKPTKEDREVFAQMAQYLINRVTYPDYYVVPETTELKPRPADKTVTKLISDLRELLLVPPADGKLSLPQEDYIREFGAALDKSLAAILVTEKGKTPPAILRVNAGRLLAVACESGAPAHWPTVIGLLKNPETPPEVYFYALKAAEGLLGGFDVSRLARLDTQANPQPERAEEILHDLVQLLEDAVIKGPPITNKVYIEGSQPTLVTDPKSKPNSLHPEQILAIQLYRLQAIRALARLRNDTLGGKVKPALEVRPVFTLARVAVSDPAISPPPSKKEVAEAVLGMVRINPGSNVNIDELTYAVSYGIRTVFSAKATNADDATIPWKSYAGRLNAAFQEWQTASAKNPNAQKRKDSINSLVKKANDGLFNPVLNPTAGTGGMNLVQLVQIDDWQRDNPPANDRQLFSDVKTFKIAYGTK